ncbi:MAG: FtsW/RodA/SpoVE family cell cycle protein [Phycisphaerales bacterium JB065]
MIGPGADPSQASEALKRARERRAAVEGLRSEGRFSERKLDDRARAEAAPKLQWATYGWLVVATSLLLCGLGMYGIALSGGLTGMSGQLDVQALILRQAAYAGLGLLVAAAVVFVHYRWYAYFSWAMAAATIVLLIFVLLPFVPEVLVTPRNGARRWISLGIADFQPSELAKVVYVLIMAVYLRFSVSHRRFFGLFQPALITLIPVGLILVEPDLGTALLFLPALLAMLIAAGAKLWHLIATGAVAMLFAAAVLTLSLSLAKSDQYPLLRPHQVQRIQAVIERFKGDERFDQGRGFQGRQARMLIGAGGFSGHPEAKSRALIEYSKLPEKHTDMIFPVLVNRFGFTGALCIILLYALWIGGAAVVAANCKDPFGRLVIVGCTTMMATQASINIGMTLGIFPITGMTLPFVSYGGSSLLMGFLVVGLILNIALRPPGRLWRRSFEFDD